MYQIHFTLESRMLIGHESCILDNYLRIYPMLLFKLLLSEFSLSMHRVLLFLINSLCCWTEGQTWPASRER